MKKPLHTSITLRQLKLQIYLGWSAQERLKKQPILLDIQLKFRNVPKACHTDNLADTVCYATLVEKIQQITQQRFRLLEHLAHEIYQIIQKNIKKQTTISLKLTKKPPIKNLTGGVTFYYGDEVITW